MYGCIKCDYTCTVTTKVNNQVNESILKHPSFHRGLPDTSQGKQNWRQHFVGDSSDSEHSDDELRAYAAAAGEALEESDEDIFSVQLPESPESFDEAVATSCSRTDHHAPDSIAPAKFSKASKAKEECKSPAKKGER